MSTRRRKFIATAHLEPGEPATIQDIFHSVATRIQGVVPTETPYTVRLTTIVTTDPTPAEIEKHVSPFHFAPEQYQDDPILEQKTAPLKAGLKKAPLRAGLKRAASDPSPECPKCKIEMRHWVNHIYKCPACGRVAWYNDDQTKTAPLRAGLKRAASTRPPEG